MKKIEAYLECVRCHKHYDLSQVRYNCECGGILDLVRDLSQVDGGELKALWESRWGQKRGAASSGVWRYKELIFDLPDEQIVTRQEGNTRLYDAGKAGVYAGLRHFQLKHEGENPTGSFKDRGMTCGTTAAKFYNAKTVACASTGNTSASMASYAAVSGMESVIFIPEGKIAYGKLAQALAYGGRTLQIRGNFDDAMALVQEVCRELNIYLLNSINPFRIEGQKAIGFEILQQLDWQVPDWFVIPGGNLGNNTALSKGMKELYDLGIIDKIPRIAVIQAAGSAPLYRMWKNHTPYQAVKDPEFVKRAAKEFRGRIAVGIDAKNGFVATEGWLETSGVNYIDLGIEMCRAGVQYFIFTDIDKDGTLSRPNHFKTKKLQETLAPLGGNVIASGGIKTINNIKTLKKNRIYGAICGKSIYSGSLDLAQAVRLAK